MMLFEEGGIYHVFNQGNNRRKVFFMRENYLFFLKKIRLHVLPYADLLAWCLMPNHFHLMIYFRDSRGSTGQKMGSRGATSSRTPTLPPFPAPTFNHSLGIMLASYTRAINLQEKFSGSLFRKGTKAVCLNEVNGVSPSWQAVQGAFQMNVNVLEDQYPQICFDYIHNNPVSAGLVKSPGDWEFSSFPDYCGMRIGTMINKERAREIGLNWNI